MTKYSKEQWIAAIKAVEAGESIGKVARVHKLNVRGLALRVSLYREHGERGLKSHAHNWTAEQKYNVLKYMHENHLSCRETGILFGISGSSTIWKWEQRYLEKGIMGLENKEKGRKRKRPTKPNASKTREELLEENLYLRAENEYLKKLNALVAEREKQERGTK